MFKIPDMIYPEIFRLYKNKNLNLASIFIYNKLL